MKSFLSILSAFYGWLLNFYPRAFREEFGEEMLSDFEDTLDSASQNSIFSLTIVLFRELRDIPINLFRTNLKEVGMLKIFRSQPVSNGLRGALGFGLAFAGASVINSFFMFGLTSRILFLNRLGTIIFDYFRAENKPTNFSILSLIILALAALVFGILFAVFFADRPQYPRYILAGMLGWFAPNAIAAVFSNTMNADHYADSMQPFYLYGSFSVLTGAFLGMVFSVAKSERREPLRLLATVTFIFPVVTYLYVKALYYFDVVNTPWIFPALMVMMSIYFISVLVIALSGDKKMLWMVFVGAIVNPIAAYLPFLLLPQQIIDPFYGFEQGIIVNSLPLLGTVILKMALQQAVFGLLLGLTLGLLLGFIKKNTSSQIMA